MTRTCAGAVPKACEAGALDPKIPFQITVAATKNNSHDKSANPVIIQIL